MDLTTTVWQRDVEPIRQAIAAGNDLDADATPVGPIVCWAAEWGRSDIIEVLMDAGVTRHPRALLLAARHGHTRTVELLLARGWDPNEPAGWTPLHAAADACFPDTVRVLLEVGADSTKRSEGHDRWAGKTPLELAEQRGADRTDLEDRCTAVRRLLNARNRRTGA